MAGDDGNGRVAFVDGFPAIVDGLNSELEIDWR